MSNVKRYKVKDIFVRASGSLEDEYVMATDYEAKCADYERLRDALEKYQWVSVEAGLPKKQGRYFVSIHGKGFKRLDCAIFTGENWLQDPLKLELIGVTHWRPLPPTACTRRYRGER